MATRLRFAPPPPALSGTRPHRRRNLPGQLREKHVTGSQLKGLQAMEKVDFMAGDTEAGCRPAPRIARVPFAIPAVERADYSLGGSLAGFCFSVPVFSFAGSTSGGSASTGFFS